MGCPRCEEGRGVRHPHGRDISRLVRNVHQAVQEPQGTEKNLRDNMTTLELVLNMLAEATTTEISKQREPETFAENMAVAREGGEVAGIARKAAEERTGVPVITSKNAAQLNQVVTNLIEGIVDDDTSKEE